MKYVIFNEDEFAVFPNYQSHAKFRDLQPIAAGYCSIHCEVSKVTEEVEYSVVCIGRSLSLGVNSRGPIDEDILQRGFKDQRLFNNTAP